LAFFWFYVSFFLSLKVEFFVFQILDAGVNRLDVHRKKILKNYFFNERKIIHLCSYLMLFGILILDFLSEL